jgi:hypothetical protein
MSSSSTPIDIKAVPGLRICTNFFSYDVENKLYNDRFFFPHSQQGVERIARQNKLIKNFRESKCITENESGGIGHLGDNDTGGTGPDLLVKLCNGIIESGTEPEFIAPNNCTFMFIITLFFHFAFLYLYLYLALRIYSF